MPGISKYNYTGKMYRFEQAEIALNVSRPDLK